MTPRFGLPVELAELADEYDILEELGRGGSAIVYRAHDRTLGRDVAIKVVHPRPTSPDDDPVARLAREARMVAQLEHHGIVSVHAVRRLRAGGLTLVLQLVPGETLKTAIQRGGPMDPGRATDVLRDVAEALAYAHVRRVVHRDVKPENIFLHAASGRALISDFGIARSTDTDSSTLTGTAIGTPFYMSPEQIEGRPVDGRSDLYSLGLVAWEMLTGRRPWDGESLYHVIYKQKHDQLPPIEAFRPDVPRPLQYIVERMLQKQPAARWAGAEGLLVQLDRRILPNDYAKWQAGLPSRIAQHAAALEAARVHEEASRASAPTRTSLAAAATVRFSPALAQTQRLAERFASSGGTPDAIGDDDTHGPQATSTPEPDRRPAPIVATETGPVALQGAIVADDSTSTPLPDAESGTRPAYDSIAPTWSSGEQQRVPAPPARPRRRARVLAAGSAALAVVAATSAVAFSARAHSDGTDRAPLSRVAAPVAVPSAALRGPGVTARVAPPTVRPTDAGENRPDSTTVRSGSGADLRRASDAIGVGARHVCSLTASGTAQCWGRNDNAQFGDGSSVAVAVSPRTVAGVMTYESIGAGAAHTCGVTRYGDVYCWGKNDLGQIGDGTTFARGAPVRVGGAGVYRSVHGGIGHTCALDIAGVVRCWGDNSVGQLGDGTRVSQVLPTVVHLPQGAAAIAVTTGARHSCAVLSDQRVVCWGANRDGQLGTAGDDGSAEPREVPGVRATEISAGDAHTCAALMDGRTQCWGRDESGQLGTMRATSGAPGRLTVIPSHDAIQAVAAGASQSCALTRGGEVWCWGSTSLGPRRAPVQLGRRGFVALAAGATQTCAVSSDHVAQCWRSGPRVAARAVVPRRASRRPRGARRGTRRV